MCSGMASPDQRPEDMRFALADTKFQCTICGECCQLEVFLTNADIERIKLGVGAETSMLEALGNRGTLSAHEDKAACRFLNDNRCSIYESRPLQCRLYPFFPIAAGDLEAVGLTVPPNAVKLYRGKAGYYFSIGRGCPGLGRGLKPDWGEILSIWLQLVKEENEG